MSKAESDEHQRNWNKEQLHRQNQNPRNFYDPTRQNMNFEIDSNGKIQPINTSPAVCKRMEDRCRALGSKPPKKKLKQPHIRLLRFIVTGDTDVMRKLAFGDQDVDYTKDEYKTANQGLHREKNIELWAKDVYDFMCRQFGKENIVGFDCHCDENSPHVHVAVVPVGPDNKVSYSGLCGDKRYKQSEYWKNFHTELAKQVSSKWGMVRGEDTSGRDVHHRDKAEYYGMLSRDIKSAEIKIKSLHTMIANLEDDKEELERQMAKLKKDIEAGRISKEKHDEELGKLQDRYSEICEKLEDKQAKLLEANQQLAALKEENEDMELKAEDAERRLNALIKEISNDAGVMAHGAMFETLYQDLQPLLANQEHLKALLGDSSELVGLDVNDLNEITRNAVQAFFYGMIGGETERVGTGGGGGTSDDDWWKRKDPDETYAALMRRCIFHSIKSYKAAKGVKRTR